MKGRRVLWVLVLAVAAGLILGGCCKGKDEEIMKAETKIKAAKDVGAEKYATAKYQSAVETLNKAKDAKCKDALELAKKAQSLAEEAKNEALVCKDREERLAEVEKKLAAAENDPNVLKYAAALLEDAKKLAAEARIADCTGGLNLANQADALLNKAYAEAAKPHEVVFTLPADVIHFDFDKYTIRADSQAILDKIADAMLANPNANVIIEGHCDHYGSNDYNMALGESRAKAARDYLVARGVSSSRIQTVSYGEERPVRACTSIADCEVNRRCEFGAK